MACYPTWMVDGQGNLFPGWLLKATGLTKATPHREVKRRSKWYILSLDAYDFDNLVTWGHTSTAPARMLNENVERWLDQHLGPEWDFKVSVWFDSEREYDREFIDISFPDLESLTLFKLVWFGNRNT